MSIAQDLVEGAYDLIGVHSPTATDITAGTAIGDDMLQEWALFDVTNISSDLYKTATKYNLAIRLAPTLSVVASAEVVAIAERSYRDIMAKNMPEADAVEDGEVEFDPYLTQRLL